MPGSGADSRRTSCATPTPLLLAEVDGRLLAAVRVGDGRSIADPFVPTRDVVAVLRAAVQGGGR